MSELRSASESVWQSARDMISAAMQKGGSLQDVKSFEPYRRARMGGRPKTYTLMVLERTIEPNEWGANRGIAHQTIEFGLTGLSYEPSSAGSELSDLAFALTDLFLADPTLLGQVHDVRVESVSPDAVPEGVEDLAQPWATVRVTWDYEFLRQ